MTTGRTDFIETWLTEMPSRLGNFGETFSILQKSIQEWIEDGHKPEQISDNLFTLSGQNIVYYWYQNDTDIILALELEKRPQGLAVTIVGKNPKYTGNAPYATDLYKEVLSLLPYSLLFSDAQLSDDGIDLWKRLLLDPEYTISVYDSKAPGKTFVTIDSNEELEKYLGYYNYRFVLSKKGKNLAETRSFFNIRRYRELVPGMSLDD
jgi:hypothetical protein